MVASVDGLLCPQAGAVDVDDEFVAQLALALDGLTSEDDIASGG